VHFGLLITFIILPRYKLIDWSFDRLIDNDTAALEPGKLNVTQDRYGDPVSGGHVIKVSRLRCRSTDEYSV